MGRKKRNNEEGAAKLLPGNTRSSSADHIEIRESGSGDNNIAENVLKLHAEAADVRKFLLIPWSALFRIF